MANKDIGVIGLGVMGMNLALNFANHGFSVAGKDVYKEIHEQFRELMAGKNATAHDDLPSFCADLAIPRKILMMVPAGKAVDALIQQLRPLLTPGDVLIDGGNAHFQDTERRIESLALSGILYLGIGISGGQEGALNGPSIMPGGTPEAWPLVRPLLQTIAAKTPDGKPCCEWIGAGGAGHFVKMVHNGIEYSDMQLIGEAFAILEQLSVMQPAEAAVVFAEWNQGALESYLIEITAKILQKKDPETASPLIHMILDRTGQKGTGTWASLAALNLGVPAQSMAEAVFARNLSALKDERITAAAMLPAPSRTFSGDRKIFVGELGKGLYAAKICCYAQGFQLLRAASAEYKWNLDFAVIARVWRAGCIIRARFLDKVGEAFAAEPSLQNLLLAPYFCAALKDNQPAWRSVVSEAVLMGISIPAFASALAYFDGYRSQVLPANLLQAQRDFFGAHTYERTDKPRGQYFHTEW